MNRRRMPWVTLGLVGVAVLGCLLLRPGMSGAIAMLPAGDGDDPDGGGGCGNSVLNVEPNVAVYCFECEKGNTSYGWSAAMPGWVCAQLCAMGLRNLPPACSCS